MKKIIQYNPQNRTIYILPRHMQAASYQNMCPYKKDVICEAAGCEVKVENGEGITFTFLCKNKKEKCEVLASYNTIIGEFEE